MAGGIRRARNGLISTSTLKSDDTIVFLNQDFLQNAKILAIRPKIRVILRIFHCACANSHISTSGLKSDVTIVFLDPDFLNDVEFLTILP